ncbi:LOW QUALITY PROTEIN: Neuroepithelial cell-transforming gene 1 protein [Galemys pyrenaicus]|uniref:Neuroepithelial cell-transforming gene 1 protein n=1 Tax=Galemys pyrenaicus TaxID=202257 RepID=A0A8J5ZYF3_GALPY|nr:LOW QUALITY PROTEIN: Neuroepithelial cell-transforming gene 1 protein [Galemys pyrenaicus]
MSQTKLRPLAHILGQFNLSCKKWSSEMLWLDHTVVYLHGDTGPRLLPRSHHADQQSQSQGLPRKKKRQGAIYEMQKQYSIEDLKFARKAYYCAPLKLTVTSEEELAHIFGDLDASILCVKICWRSNQVWKNTGADWSHPCDLPDSGAYKVYFSNHLTVKVLLNQKKQGSRVQEFLWPYRICLIKHLLLLKEILRHTPKDHQLLEEAVSVIHGVLSDTNLKKGKSECQYYIDNLGHQVEKQKDPRIKASQVLLCYGELKNKYGHELCLFLFQDVLVLTQPVYRQPVQELVLEEHQGVDVRMGGSLPGAFSNSDKTKNTFRARSLTPCKPVKGPTSSCGSLASTLPCPSQQASRPAGLQALPDLHKESEE